MDEKRRLAEVADPAVEPRLCSSAACRWRRWQRRQRLLRLGYLAALALVGFTVFVLLQPRPLLEVTAWRPAAPAPTEAVAKPGKTGAGQASPAAHTSGYLVPLEAHIMSKCPDAQDCLRDLIMPTMQQVYEKVNFSLSYIGRPTGDGGVECMHGPAECMGNILELCAHKLYPEPKTFLGFTWCLTRDYSHIPDRDLVEDCALEHAVDVAALDECATRDDGQYAMNLLGDSVRHSSAAGVTKSCTVRLDNQVYCIRDDGEWKDCPAGPSVHDLIITVERLYRQNREQ